MFRKKVLVTGGAGFIGSHLCRALLNKGYEVICMDSFYTGSKRNVQDLCSNPLFTLLEQDVTEPVNVTVDEIYNMACPASPVHYQADPIKTLKANVLGAFNMLELAKRNGASILQASTSEVYGDPLVHPQPEDYWGNVNPVGVRACYDEGKRCAETAFFDYQRQYGTNIKVVRIFNTYGPNMLVGDGRVVSNFIVQALTSQDITIYGDGTQTRSFCFISDLIDGILRMMESAPEFSGPVNLGNPEEITIEDLAERIIKMTGSCSKFSFRPLPVNDPRQRKPDTRLAMKHLNWCPVVSVEEGIQQTIAWFRKVLC